MKTLTEKELTSITNDFYSYFCGTDLSGISRGTHFICSMARDEEVKGFGCRYTVYVLVKDDICVVAYAPQYAFFFDRLKGCSVDEILSALDNTYNVKKMCLMIFRHETVQAYGDARILRKSDYPLFEAFFCRTHPSANPAGWLKDYFEEKASKEYITGYFADGRLVSVCDAPDMPYMEDAIQHTGIMTLQGERRKGYAKCTAALAAHHLTEMGVCPQWECQRDNAASLALAQSVGFEKYGMAYILEE